MEIIFEKLINSVFISDINLLFGESSKIIVEEIGYSTNLKQKFVSVKLIPGNPEMSLEVYPESLIFLVEDLWRYFENDTKIIVRTSIDYGAPDSTLKELG